MNRKTIADIDVKDKRVLVRVDFNVPLDKGTNRILDGGRIEATLPTIKYLIENRAKTILCSHLGRPQGKVDEALRLAPIAGYLSKLLNRDVEYVRNCIGTEVEEAARRLGPGDVLLLENLRFHPGETENAPDFAKALASLANIYVNDAFGAAHRVHSSVVGIGRFLPAVAGFLMQRELEMLGRILENPVSPFGSISGGVKIGDKIAVLENLAKKVDILLVGGGMAATFLKSKGVEVGTSLVEEEDVEFAGSLLKKVGEKIVLPVDFTVAQDFREDAPYRVAPVGDIAPNECVMDIGPNTTALFEEKLMRCKMVIWNGPMGVYEWKPFAVGTERIAHILADLPDAITLVGGGSTADAVHDLGLASKVTHVSTGGGASLEFLEGKVLPGVAALMER